MRPRLDPCFYWILAAAAFVAGVLVMAPACHCGSHIDELPVVCWEHETITVPLEDWQAARKRAGGDR